MLVNSCLIACETLYRNTQNPKSKLYTVFRSSCGQSLSDGDPPGTASRNNLSEPTLQSPYHSELLDSECLTAIR